MTYIIENIKYIDLLKSKDKDSIVQKLKEGSHDYIQNIDEKLISLNQLQFSIMLKKEVDRLFNIYKQINQSETKNKEIQNIYVQSYFNTYKTLENKYKPFVKEAFKEQFEFWVAQKNYSYNETVWQNSRNKFEIKKARNYKKETKSAGWHSVFIEIILGKINIVKKDNYSYKYFYENIEFKSPTEIGKKIAEKHRQKEDTIRPILTDSINGGKSKNIFIKNNLKKMNELIDLHGNKMCNYFKDKLEELN